MEHITIRPASGQDAGTVFGFVKDLAEHHNAADMVTASAEDFQKMLDASFPVFEALIAEDENGQAVGCALFFERFSTWKGPTIHIEDLMVDPAQRGKHIGEKLMDAVVDTARRRGITRIELDVEGDNEGAIRFYQRKGFDTTWYAAKLYLDK